MIESLTISHNPAARSMTRRTVGRSIEERAARYHVSKSLSLVWTNRALRRADEGRAVVVGAAVGEGDTEDVGGHLPLAEDALLGPDGTLVLRELGVARVGTCLLDALLDPEEPDELLAHRHDVIRHRIVRERVHVVVVPLIDGDLHVGQLLVLAPPVDRHILIVVIAHRRNVLAGPREGQPDDLPPMVAMDHA